MPALGGMLEKLNPWHQKDKPNPPPIIPKTAFLLVVIYALVYFLPFYASSLTRPSPTLSRDAPSVIRARITSVTISCVVCCVATYLILVHPPTGETPGLPGSHVIHLMGFWPVAVADSLKALFLTALLFLGPLFSYFIVEGGWHDWISLRPLRELWSEWTMWRNLVAGPITEEILFRSASIPLMISSQTPVRQTIFLTPIIFGLSHVHHFYEFRLSNPQVPAKAALFRSVFQLVYTTLFGAYATFIFIRTGSLFSVCAIHAFCNCMGLPQLWGRVEPPEERVVPIPTPTPAQLRDESSSPERLTRRASILWTVAYYVLLVSGAVSWYRNLFVLSESENGLVLTEVFAPSS